MAITLSHGGPTIYRSPAPSRQVLVGTIEGVVCMERDAGGPGWHVAAPDADRQAHPRPPDRAGERHDLRRGNHGSIFASADGGHSWERRDEGLTRARRLQSRVHPAGRTACASSPGRSPRTSTAATISGVAGPSLPPCDRWTCPGGDSPPRPTSPTPSTSPFIPRTRHPVHRGGAGRPPEEHGCGAHVPGGPGDGRRRAPHGDQSAERRPRCTSRRASGST